MKKIPITRGLFILVDDADFDWLNQWSWHICSGGKYVGRTERGRRVDKRKRIYIHREIMSAPLGCDVDHINGNTLDNRRCNLRLCTRSENLMNSKKSKNKTSKYKGVSFEKQTGRWRSHITLKGKNMKIGRYETEAEAALSYNRMAAEMFGPYARINTIKELENDEKNPAFN